MKIFQLVCNLTILTLVVLLTGLNVEAQKIQIDTADNPLKFVGVEAETIEPSAIEAIGDGKYLLVADDKTGADNNSLAIVEASNGNVIKRLQIPDRTKNPKWEGLAQDNKGNFYVVGSHFDDKPENLKARSFLYRFRLKMDEDPAKIDIDVNSVIELNIKNSLKANNLYDENPLLSKTKIEGLAVRINKGKKELIIGLREPSDFVWGFSAELPSVPKDKDELSLKPFFKFYAGKIQSVSFKLSSIEYAPNLKGFVILTSTEDVNSNAFHGNTLWFLSDETLVNTKPSTDKFKRVSPQLTWVFGMDMKAEGICVLPDSGSSMSKLRLAIVFDNDKKDTGNLGMMQFVWLMSGKE